MSSEHVEVNGRRPAADDAAVIAEGAQLKQTPPPTNDIGDIGDIGESNVPKEPSSVEGSREIVPALEAPAEVGTAVARDRSQADVGTDRAAMIEACTPFWNYRARWFLLYFLPIGGLLAVLTWLGRPLVAADAPWHATLAAGWGQINGRDFWVPALWALWMPWFNGPHSPVPGMRRIVFRDFNGNAKFYFTISLLHGLVWSLCLMLPVPLYVSAMAFAAAFLTYDIFLIRYNLLEIYFKRMAADIGPLTVVFSGLSGWWIYLVTGLSLAHMYGANTPLSVLVSTALIVAPMQLMLILRRRRPVQVKVRKVAVIGAGWSGMYATKWLAQAGLDVRTFERKGHLGGLWKYDTDAPSTVSDETFASSSNFYLHASDFPIDTSPFPTHQQIFQFLNDYADRFNLRDYISFNTSIRSVKKQGDTWVVTGVSEDGEFSEEFDAVVVSSGFNGTPQNFQARYQGFSGEIMHSSTYKHTDDEAVAKHKRIVVVGLGESAADIAHECARIRSKDVYLSGSTQWFAGRFMAGDFAADTLMAPGVRTLMARTMDLEYRGRQLIQRVVHLIWGDQGSGVKEWQVDVPWLHGFVTKSRAAVEDVHRGNLVPKSRIVSCSGRTITFEDGSTVEADLIIDCTGFQPSFPFLDKKFCFTKLYNLVFDREDPTLSFTGTARPVLGSIPGLAEMQARWVASVYSGRASLPEHEEQEIETFYSRRAHKKRFFTAEKRPNLVDHSFYADGIARRLAIDVPWLRTLLTMPHKLQMLLLAPWMAFKYELRGPRYRQALQNMKAHMPKAKMYYFFIKKRFLRIAMVVWLIQLGLIAVVATSVPGYVLLAIIAVMLAQWMGREMYIRHRRLRY